MTMLTFNITAQIPVNQARPAVFDDGVFDVWGDNINELKTIDVTIDFESEPIDLSCAEDELFYLEQEIRESEWDSDFNDELLRRAIENTCRNLIGDNYNDLSDDGNGCDGTILIELGDEITFGEPYWTNIHTGDFDPIDFDKLGQDIAESCAFDNSNGYEGTWHYIVGDEEVQEGNPIFTNGKITGKRVIRR